MTSVSRAGDEKSECESDDDESDAKGERAGVFKEEGSCEKVCEDETNESAARTQESSCKLTFTASKHCRSAIISRCVVMTSWADG